MVFIGFLHTDVETWDTHPDFLQQMVVFPKKEGDGRPWWVGSMVDAYGAIWNHGTPEKNGQNLMVFTISRVASATCRVSIAIEDQDGNLNRHFSVFKAKVFMVESLFFMVNHGIM